MKRLPLKPLWKFGWMGWCLLAAALFLAGAMVAGVDVQFWILHKITWIFGIKATYWITTVFFPGHALFDFPFLLSAWRWNSPAMRFSLTTMVAVLVARQVHPARSGLLKTWAVVVMGVVGPALMYLATNWVRTPVGPTGVLSSFDEAMTIVLFVWALIAVAMLAWVIGSLRVVAACAGFLLIGAWLTTEQGRAASIPPTPPLLMAVDGTDFWFFWLSWLWNPMFFACLLTWAIRARRRLFPAHACQDCGYDMRGAPQSVCPECGINTSSTHHPHKSPDPSETRHPHP